MKRVGELWIPIFIGMAEDFFLSLRGGLLQKDNVAISLIICVYSRDCFASFRGMYGLEGCSRNDGSKSKEEGKMQLPVIDINACRG